MDIIIGLIFWKAVEDMLEFEEYKVKLNNIKPTLDGLGTALKLDDAKAEIAELEAESAKDGFWNDIDRSQKVQKRLKQLQQKCEKYEKLRSTWDDLMVICEMALEENDDSMLGELEADYAKLESELEAMRLSTLLSGEYDANNAILSIHPGAGGTEAQDWAQMLYRMYTRWAERHGYAYTLMDWQDGEEAGIKSATIKIEGENAYGYLKSEHGVHRLVRISPFDASGRRQTSFAAVEVMPEITDTGEIELRDEDIKMDVFRSSGAGGQKVNKTSSAIRVTHLPTGTVVECQDERSQYKNKARALSVLASRLAQAEKEKQDAAVSAQRRSQVGSGMRNERIRTYNFPQGRVTDHRIGLTLYKLDAVMNGDLDELIDALLTARRAEQLQNSENGGM